MKKMLFTTAALGATTLLASGCGAIIGGQGGDAGSLTVYTVTGPEVTEPLIAAFNEAHPDIKVDVVTSAGTGELMARVESESGNPLGDVVWGGSTENYDAVSEGVFAEVELDNDASMIAQDPDNRWHATDVLYQVIMVNTDRVSESDGYPETMQDLTDSKWKDLGGVAFATPRSSGTTYSVLAAAVSEYGWDYVDALVANANLLDGSGAMFEGVRDGEYPIGFINEDLGATWVDSGLPVEVIYPSDTVSNQIGAAAVIEGAGNQDQAEIFVDYLMSTEGQETIRDAAGRRSARTDVDPPSALPAADDLNLATPDPAEFAVGKEKVLEQWDEHAGTE